MKPAVKPTTAVSVACMSLLLLVPLVVQGGYYGGIVCACGIVAAVAAPAVLLFLTRRGGARLDRTALLAPVLFFFLALAYLVCALANTPTLTTLSETGAWFAAAAVGLFACLQSPTARERTLAVLCRGGAIGAAAGFLMFASFLPWPFSMNDGRLQFVLQYANAAAVWFGVTALLSLLSGRKDLEGLFALPVAAMLLTQSAGAVLAFSAVMLGLLVSWWVRRDARRIVGALVQVLLAALAFVLVQRTGNALVCLLAIADLAIAAWLYPRIGEWLGDWWRGPQAAAVLTGVIALGFVALLIVYSPRAIEALGHLSARWVYVLDALRMVAESPVLGIGPDNWQFAYSFHQSAQYSTAVVHCSYAQVALDAGLVGLAFMAAAVVVGMVRLARAGRTGELLALALLAAHSLVDFDLQFGALAFLLVFLACSPTAGNREAAQAAGDPPGTADRPTLDAGRAGASGTRGKKGAASAKTRPPDRSQPVVQEGGRARTGGGVEAAGQSVALGAAEKAFVAIASFACLVGCVAGLFAAAIKAEIGLANDNADYALAAGLYQGNPLAYNDVNARANYLEAMLKEGLYEEVLSAYELYGVQSGRQALAVADALFALERPFDAIGLLVDELERQPYNVGLFVRTYNLAYGLDLPDDLRRRYLGAIQNANDLAASGAAAKLEGQIVETMPPSGEDLRAAEQAAAAVGQAGE